MTVVYWLHWWDGHHPRQMWDQHLLQATLERLPVTHHITQGVELVDDAPGAIVVVPGAYAHEDVNRINDFIAPFDRVLVVVSSDEESRFPHEQLDHPDMRVWLMYGRPERGPVDRWLPIGYHPDTRRILASLPENRPYAWVFDGQVNHPHRVSMKAATAALEGPLSRDANLWTATHGFAQGHDRAEYLTRLASAQIALCPAGPCSPDSFRCWEALEAGTLPLVGATSPQIPDPGFWQRLCDGDPPFPMIDNWEHLAGHLTDALADWPHNINRASAWWQQQKLRLHWDLADTLTWLGGSVGEDPITVLVSASPIESNPDTTIIEATVGSVRERLPDAPIVLMFDGPRDELPDDRRAAYAEHIRRVLKVANQQWDRCYPIVADRWMHQAALTRQALAVVRSPCVLFIEHDTPLEQDLDFTELTAPILSGDLDVLRFHFESEILRVHRHLMLDTEPIELAGVPVVRTRQWSQRPHLASTAYYRERLAAFSPESRCFIEDVLVGVLERSFLTDQRMGWYQHRVAVYHPEGNIRRSHHLDGRGSEDKGRQYFAYDGEAPAGAPAQRWVAGS